MFREISLGIRSYGLAMSLIPKLKLWKYFLIPICLGIILFVLLLLLGYSLSDNLASLISDWYPYEKGRQSYLVLTEWLSGISIVILGLVVFKHVLMAVSAPFMSPVSERIEKHLYPIIDATAGQPTSSNWQQLVRGVRINFRNLMRELMITVPLLLLSLIPVVGILFVITSLLVQSYYAGYGNLDYTLERHKNYRQSLLFVKSHRGLALGNGLVFTGILLIPILGVLMVLPLSTTAATISTLKILHGK